MFYKEWVDFVIFPYDVNKCWSREIRLDTSKAIRPTDFENSDVPLEAINERGVIFTIDRILFDDDVFEMMFVSESGKVTVWTKKRVWHLYHFAAVEQMKFVPKHPDSDDLWLSAHKIEQSDAK